MIFTVQQIADFINGKIEGNSQILINSVGKIEDSKSGDICFLANEKYIKYTYTTKASAIIVGTSFKVDKSKMITPVLIRVEDPYSSFSKLLEMYNKKRYDKTGISKHSDISENCKIGENCFIGSFTKIEDNVIIGENVKIHSNCYIGENVIIEKNSIIFSNVSIYHDTKIGAHNIIHSGSILGSDGFGFAANNNKFNKIMQIGNVVTKKNVEIGANTCIDRATMGSTKICAGVKLDNLIQVAHNVEIGENTVIASQTAIAGSTKIGKNCMIGGKVAIAGHLVIANKVKIAGQSGVASSITKIGSVVQGPLAFDIKQFQRSYILFKKLPELFKAVESNKNIK